MEYKFTNFLGEQQTVHLVIHPITKYDVLFHVTLKTNRENIEKNGILLNQEPYKSLSKTGMTYYSYPVDMDTSDCFRWSDEYYSLVVLDAKKLKEDGVLFYDDPFSQNDKSSKRNHLCCAQNIDNKYIKQIIEF